MTGRNEYIVTASKSIMICADTEKEAINKSIDIFHDMKGDDYNIICEELVEYGMDEKELNEFNDN